MGSVKLAGTGLAESHHITPQLHTTRDGWARLWPRHIRRRMTEIIVNFLDFELLLNVRGEAQKPFGVVTVSRKTWRGRCNVVVFVAMRTTPELGTSLLAFADWDGSICRCHSVCLIQNIG